MGRPRQTDPLLAAIPKQRISDLIAERVATAIRDGALQPGDRLPTEMELARGFSVGRTSVREALQKLETLGLIHVERGRGAFVNAPDQIEAHRTFARWSAEHRFAIEELLETRMSVEATAAALAATRAGAECIEELSARNAELLRAAAAGDLPAVISADEAFHDALMRASKNELLRKVYSLLVAEIAEFRAKTLSLDGAPERASADHDAIVAAIGAGNVRGARTAMINHLWVLYQEVREAAASQQPDRTSVLQGATRETFR